MFLASENVSEFGLLYDEGLKTTGISARLSLLLLFPLGFSGDSTLYDVS
jgi:hypothetical protein